MIFEKSIRVFGQFFKYSVQHLPHSQVEKAKTHSVCRCAAGSALAGPCPPYALVQPRPLSQPVLETWDWKAKCHPPKPRRRGCPGINESTHSSEHSWSEALIVCKNCTLLDMQWFIKPHAPHAKYPIYPQNRDTC